MSKKGPVSHVQVKHEWRVNAPRVNPTHRAADEALMSAVLGRPFRWTDDDRDLLQTETEEEPTP